MWRIQESTASLPGLHDLSTDGRDVIRSQTALDSALDILDGSVSQFSTLMPNKTDAMSMLLLSDSFQAGTSESFRADRFIESSSVSLFETSASTASRRSTGGDRTLLDLRRSTSLTRESSASPVHMILDRSSHKTDGLSGITANSFSSAGAMSSPLPAGTGRGSYSVGPPSGPIVRETSTQPYHLSVSPESLMTGSAFNRSAHSAQMDISASSLPMNVSKSLAGRSQVYQSNNSTMPIESSVADIRVNTSIELKLVQVIPLVEGTSTDLQCSYSGSHQQLVSLSVSSWL